MCGRALNVQHDGTARSSTLPLVTREPNTNSNMVCSASARFCIYRNGNEDVMMWLYVLDS